MIKKENNNIESVYKGTTTIGQMYKGTQLLYESAITLEQTGVPPIITTHKATGKDLIDYKIYGNSIQNGTPTPTNPVEIESVGERTANILDKNLSQIGYVDYIKSNGYTPQGKIWSELTPYTGQSARFYTTRPIPIKPNTTYSYSGLQTANNPAYIFLEEDQSTIINGAAIRGSATFQTPLNARYIVMSINRDYVNTMMLQEGQTTDYEPYGYKIPVIARSYEAPVTPITTSNIYLDEPLRKVGDYADYIDFGNSKVIRKCKEYIVTGEENYVGNNAYIKSDATDYYIILSDMYNGNFGTVVGISNQLTYSKKAIWGTVGYVNEMTINRLQFHMNIENSLLGITDYESETITTAKEKFTNYIQNKYSSGNPIKVLYPLQTPIEESITLPNIPTIKGTTIFEIDTEIQPSSMYIKYKGK